MLRPTTAVSCQVSTECYVGDPANAGLPGPLVEAQGYVRRFLRALKALVSPASSVAAVPNSVLDRRFVTLSLSGRDYKLTIHKVGLSSGFHFGNNLHQFSTPPPFPEGKIPQRIFRKEYSCGENYVGREVSTL